MKAEAETTKTVKVSFRGKKEADKVWKAPVGLEIRSVKNDKIKEEHGAKLSYNIQRKEVQLSTTGDASTVTKAKKKLRDRNNVDTIQISYKGKEKKSRASGHLTVTVGQKGEITTPSRPGRETIASTPDTTASSDELKEERSSVPFSLQSESKKVLSHPPIPEEEEEELTPLDDGQEFEPLASLGVEESESFGVLLDGVVNKTTTGKPGHSILFWATLLISLHLLLSYCLFTGYDETGLLETLHAPIQHVRDNYIPDEILPAVNLWKQFLKSISIEWTGNTGSAGTPEL